jgi:hypothetical protein
MFDVQWALAVAEKCAAASTSPGISTIDID